MQLEFRPITPADVKQIVSWRYKAPYELYNIETDNVEREVKTFTDPDHAYYGIWHAQELVGFCCFGVEGQVPGGDYSDDALDVGMGMRPDLTGQGRGRDYMVAVMAFARQTFAATTLRATVAAFNERALRACKASGLRVTQTFTRPRDGLRFVVLDDTPLRDEA